MTQTIQITLTFDPRELYYVAGFSDSLVEWSFDHESAAAALLRFKKGENRLSTPTRDLSSILQSNPPVIVTASGEAADSLRKSAEKMGTSVYQFVRKILGVDQVELELH